MAKIFDNKNSGEFVCPFPRTAPISKIYAALMLHPMTVKINNT